MNPTTALSAPLLGRYGLHPTVHRRYGIGGGREDAFLDFTYSISTGLSNCSFAKSPACSIALVLSTCRETATRSASPGERRSEGRAGGSDPCPLHGYQDASTMGGRRRENDSAFSALCGGLIAMTQSARGKNHLPPVAQCSRTALTGYRGNAKHE